MESYALQLLNIRLRPYLSKWHPKWDAWRKKNPDAAQAEWPDHASFREELRALQRSMRECTLGLGQIAGIGEPSRYLSGESAMRNQKEVC